MMNKSNTKIYTIFKDGGDFKKEHVANMKNMCFNNLNGLPFFCITRDWVFANKVKPLNDFPGYWSKIELFRFQGPLIYFDLDIIIQKNILDIFDKIDNSNFISLKDPNYNEFNSSIMMWNVDLSFIYKRFIENPKKYIGMFKGDQDFITDCVRNSKIKHSYLQDFYKALSFKSDIKNSDDLQSPIIYFHGKPRPWEQKKINYWQTGQLKY